MSDNDIIAPVLLLMVNSKIFWLWLFGLFISGAAWEGPLKNSKYWLASCAWTCFVMAVAVGRPICS